ncbi:MAG: hypothetical protein QOJ76_2531 [Acidobacteriota bacterium]|jgi:hypothetical protein|nr:hypothetical protein [Acidobacteriota bacterium]
MKTTQEAVMKNHRSLKVSTDGDAAARSHARALAYCLLALLVAVVCGAGRALAAQVRPADSSKPQSRSQQQAVQPKTSSADEDDDDESESGHVFDGAATRPRATDPATIMRKAHFIYVRSDSVFISGSEVEDSLRKRKEFQAWGMAITRSEADADLIVEITRKSLTRRFTFSVIDPRTMEVVTSGKTRSVIFGKKIANKIAEKFANRLKAVRPYPPASASNP